MKIHELQGQYPIKGAKTDKSNSSAEGTDFQRLLDDRLRSVGETKKVAQSTSIHSESAVPASLRIESLALTESTIDTLAAYSTALGKKELSVSDLEPLVSALEEETVGLLDMKNKLPGEDTLSQLLDRVSTTAYLEVAKYRRGDYRA